MPTVERTAFINSVIRRPSSSRIAIMQLKGQYWPNWWAAGRALHMVGSYEGGFAISYGKLAEVIWE
jgi:hypothetical protein